MHDSTLSFILNRLEVPILIWCVGLRDQPINSLNGRADDVRLLAFTIRILFVADDGARRLLHSKCNPIFWLRLQEIDVFVGVVDLDGVLVHFVVGFNRLMLGTF